MISAAKRLVDDVYWTPAVFIGTAAGGVVWAIVARSTVFERNPDLSARDGWLVVGLGCLGVLLAGLALAVWSRPPVLRTIGVALLVVALSGGSVLAVWGPLFVMVMAGS